MERFGNVNEESFTVLQRQLLGRREANGSAKSGKQLNEVKAWDGEYHNEDDQMR
jgi:hypothetical protein